MKIYFAIIIFTVALVIFTGDFWLGEYLKEFKKDSYLINTKKCKIPNISPFSTSLINFKRNATSCTNFDPLLSFTSIQDGIARLYIREEAVINYFGSPDSIRCCYSYIYRNGTEFLPDVGIAATNCIEFNSIVELKHDLVRISCSKSNYNHVTSIDGYPVTPIYQNIHQVITVSENIKRKAKKLIKSTTKKPISILMMVIDSVSRLNFIRTMPQTKNFVLNNNFYEFKGYNKVDDNTYPNAMAFLAGLNATDAKDICKSTELDGLMNCPLIWYKYKNLGYSTAYAEDWSPLATFNYLKKGFRYNPTDYYFKPYMDAITFLNTTLQDTMPFCAGPESQGDRILNLAYDFANNLKSIPSFGVFWMNTFSHNNISTPITMDHKVAHFFEKLKASKILDSSIVVLLSDHGIRFGKINKTPRGFYEVRLPMNYISLPTWFKNEYPVETKNFEDNTQKLISNYDLYMTLQHILKLSGTNHTITSSRGCPHCRSLFEKIPNDRSCSESGIPDHWCTCNVNISNTNNYN